MAIKQKFLITSSSKEKAEEEVETLLNDGWTIISVSPRCVSVSTNSHNSTTIHGGFGILFEKLFPVKTTEEGQ